MLVVFGIVVIFVVSIGVLFDLGGLLGYEVYFDFLMMFVVLLLLVCWFEFGVCYCVVEVLEVVVGIFFIVVECLCDDGISECVVFEVLWVGDCICVVVGEVFVVDGCVLVG